MESYLAFALPSNDEGLHSNFTCLLPNCLLVYPTTPAHIHTIIWCDAVNIEHKVGLLLSSLMLASRVHVRLLGMNTGLMCQYIVFCASPHGCPHIYSVTNPFPWMTFISLQGF
jgi:hypothetical protein